MFFSDWSVSRKLAAAFAVLSAVFLLMSGVLTLRMSATQAAVETDEYSYRMLELSDAMMAALANQQDSMRGFIARPDDRYLKAFARYGDDYASAATTFQATARSDAEKGDGARIGQLADQFHQEAQQILALAHDPAKLQQARDAVISQGRLHDVREVVKSIALRERENRVQRRQLERRAFQAAMTALALGAIAAVGFAALLAWATIRNIGRPVAILAETTARLATGDASAPLPVSDRQDELGQMTRALQGFKAALDDKVSLQDEAETQRQATETEKTRHAAAREAAISQQTMALQAIGGGLEKMAAGEMTFRLDQPFKLEIKASAALYEKLRTDFNAAMDKLQDVMGTVLTSTSAIRSGAGEISVAADDLSRRTEQQAASLEETAAALDQITATVKKTAAGAIQARDAVSNAKADAERSGAVVRDAVTAMSGIEQSSRQIGQIIGVIDEIAFQTNLLALNAGVEAARAGDAGRGFAVVASEVRALAQRSADAAREIKGLISASAEHVAAGVSLVGETGVALERIVAQVISINAVVVEIAASAQEQATGLHEVNGAINQMDQVTQQNAAMVEQSTAASHGLTQETETLARAVGQFSTGVEVAAVPRPARAQATRPQANRPSAPAPAMRTLGRGGPAPKSAPVGDSDGWEEF